MSGSNPMYVLVYICGHVVQQPNGPSYVGGRTIPISIVRGITLNDLQEMIWNAAGMPATVMKITYPFPIMSYPHATYQYAAVDVVDDSSIGIMFDISDKITGYTPVLFTETMDAIGSQANESVVHHRSSHRSQRQSRPNISQHRQNDNTFIQNEENFEDVDEEPIIHEEVHDDITDIGAFEMHIRDMDEASQSSAEDVDAELEADEGEGTAIGMFEKPSTMMTQDTWTNLVDPSPPMPTSSHVGWDGRSELFEGQIFFSKLEVKNTVKKYSMDRNYVAKTEQSTTRLLVYKCGNQNPCSWRLRAIRKPDQDVWKITRYAGPHSCLAFNVTTDHQMLDARYIANMIMSTVEADPSMKVKAFQAMVKDKCDGYYPSYAKTWAAKQMAIAAIYGDWEYSFAELPQYLAAIKERNPGTQTHIITKETARPGHVIFDAVFWAFGPAIEGFKHCRPVISVDGTFLTGKYKGTLLVAVTQDAENQIFPIAFAIVEKENKENWGWFLDCIRFYVTQRQGLCLISDRHAGLLSYLKGAPQWRPPVAYHRYCARHLGVNYIRRYNKTVGDQVKLAACEIQVRKFEIEMQKLQRFSDGAVNKDLEELPLRKWSYAHDGGRRYGSRTTNLSESFNGVLKEARHLPIVATIRTTFYKCVTYFNDYAVKARDGIESGKTFSKFATEKYDEWRMRARRHEVIEFDRETGIYEVRTPINPTSPYKGNHRHTVHLNEQTCTCNKMQQWRMPCSHVIAVCNKMAIDPTRFIGNVWRLDSNIAIYSSETFVPLHDKPYWPSYDGPIIHPDEERLRGRGRPQVNRFRNEMDMMDDWLEAQPSHKQSCTLCGGHGHNKRKCSKRGEASSSVPNM
ncbi:hypothetical protein RHGRI_003534 [Rhododendron griersonianum]|uniref:SWIM-type domain-containing protein n=1 Tax=Rhododendron griersonianum TaxID=479676 RepID=A0AAV6L7B3_9ERIC|nr:hypothetical protein RHGRI_003534 [Rhododendron griersonianum]